MEDRDLSVEITGDQYSKLVGFVFVFNLIVGTGALTIPDAFKEAGWLLSLIGIIALAFMSYITLTFMTETMAISNARLRFDKFVSQTSNNHGTKSLDEGQSPPQEDISGIQNTDETVPLLRQTPTSYSNARPSFEIRQRVEMGGMALMYFNKMGMALFHLCIIVYLYGDLAIYAAAVPKSLRDVVCTYRKNSSNCNETEVDSDPCWEEGGLNRMDSYRIFVAAFVLCLGPFVFFNVTKTKYLQIVTSVARWAAFLIMIILTSIRLGQGKGTGTPVVADISGVPNLFGVCVYSFMCHHSLPSLITPVKNKKDLLSMLAGNYVIILLFYLLLCFTAVYGFGNINDLFTLNFRPNACDSATDIVPFQYFLALFPVFTLSTSFPIIAITLRNNIIASLNSAVSGGLSWKMEKLACPLLALIPPIVIAMGTNKVEVLVGITGSYAGAGIQYVIPAVLVFLARKDILAIGGDYQHKSPFAHVGWVILTVSWAVVCIGFVTVNHIITGK